MGAWGEGNFDNDDAADWFYDFEEDGAHAIPAAFAAVSEAKASGHVEALEGSQALGAAELVACSFGKRARGLRDDIAAACGRRPSEITAISGIEGDALEAISIIEGSESELAQFWEEDGPNATWRAVLADLRARLQ